MYVASSQVNQWPDSKIDSKQLVMSAVDRCDTSLQELKTDALPEKDSFSKPEGILAIKTFLSVQLYAE